MKSSNILKRARKQIAHSSADYMANNLKPRYLCYAIEDVTNNKGPKERTSAYMLRKIISDRLGNEHSTLDDWLRANHKPAAKLWDKYLKDSSRTTSKYWYEFVDHTQQARINWIDSLIVEYQSKGD